MVAINCGLRLVRSSGDFLAVAEVMRIHGHTHNPLRHPCIASSLLCVAAVLLLHLITLLRLHPTR